MRGKGNNKKNQKQKEEKSKLAHKLKVTKKIYREGKEGSWKGTNPE